MLTSGWYAGLGGGGASAGYTLHWKTARSYPPTDTTHLLCGAKWTSMTWEEWPMYSLRTEKEVLRYQHNG